MFNSHTYGIDLGSGFVKIYSQQSDEILKERNMIAVRNRDEILAAGNSAYEMYEKNPPEIVVASPMAGGMIANISYLEIVLHYLLGKTGRKVGQHPVIYFAVPVDMTEIEKRAYYTVAHSGQLRKSKVLLVEKPLADALALGIPINKTRGSMIVNIGAATTEISVIADARVIISKIVPVGGDQFNSDIVNTVRRKHNFSISLRTANRLKTALADLNLQTGRKIARKIVGMDSLTGLPREQVITSQTIQDSILASVTGIAEEIRTFLERTPPQIHRNILTEGIYLTGGSTRIPCIDRILSVETGCSILLSQYYDLCTVYGLKEIITHDALHHWAFTPKFRK